MIHKIIATALKDKKAMAFVRRTLLASYASIFILYEKEARTIINKTFVLLESYSRDSKAPLGSIISKIHKDVYKNNGKNGWFELLYRNYKMQVRSQKDYQVSAKYIKGKVLDFGSNGGYFALELKKNNIPVWTTDVLDCRDSSAMEIPFTLMKKPNSIPFKNMHFDTAVVKTVFHHIEDINLLPILSALRGVTDSLVIKEDIFGVCESDFLESNILERDSFLREYIKLSYESQFNTLIIADFIGNILAHGIDNMDLPFNFKTIQEWRVLLRAAGFKVKKILWYGFDANSKLHQNLQAWLICE